MAFPHEYFTGVGGGGSYRGVQLTMRLHTVQKAFGYLVNVIKKTLWWETQSISVQDVESCCGLTLTQLGSSHEITFKCNIQLIQA